MSSSPALDVAAHAPARSGTLVRASLVRLASDGIGLVLGMISSIVTARVLGPAGKGTLAALSFVTLLMIQCSTLGLGDAAVVHIGQAKASAQQALSSSLVVVTLASLVGASVVLTYSVLQLPIHDALIWLAVAIACLTVVVGATGQLLVFFVYARQRLVAVSVLTIVVSITTTVAVVVFCVSLNLGVLGGVLASLLAAVIALVAAAVMLTRQRLSLRPLLVASYLRPALGFGLRAQLANVLAYSSARVDLLIVYALASHHEAGLYSVALTLGTVTGFVAIALSYASFPRMAGMSDADAFELTASMARIGTLVGIALAATISLALAPVIAIALGHAYAGALLPGIVLLLANVLWGVQWLLSRAVAARGDPRLLVRAFSANLITMAVADLILVPRAGALGAAAGSLVAAVIGLAVCLGAYRARGIRPASFVPRRSDLRLLWDTMRGMRQAAAPAPNDVEP